MKSMIRSFVAVALVLLLVMPQVAMAAPGNGNGKGQDKNWEKWYEKKVEQSYKKLIDDYEEIDSDRVKVNGWGVKFDTPPVIKAGRTLIPVRAITEGIGGQVEWDPETYEAIIISPDGLITIIFNLEDGTIEVVIVDEKGDEVDRYWATTDVPPGLIHNRTFVPLRFIAETFGLKVGYDEDTGQIDISNEPGLVPGKVTYNSMDEVVETMVGVKLNGFRFDGIEGLTEDVDYTTGPGLNIVLADNTSDASLIVYLKEDYIKGLTEEETELEFMFSLDGKVETETFEIKLKYNDAEPVVNPDEVEYSSGDGSITVNVTLNDFTLDSITYNKGGVVELNKGVDYLHDDDEVIFSESFLAGFNQEELELNFNFSKGGQEESEELEIHFLDYEEEEDEEEEDEDEEEEDDK